VWVLFQIFVKDGYSTDHFLAFLCLNDKGLEAVKRAQQHYRDSFHEVLEQVVDSYIGDDTEGIVFDLGGNPGVR
jgi:hypothetical protein